MRFHEEATSPYFLIALTHSTPLITEDRGLRQVAERLNAANFALEESDMLLTLSLIESEQ